MVSDFKLSYVCVLKFVELVDSLEYPEHLLCSAISEAAISFLKYILTWGEWDFLDRQNNSLPPVQNLLVSP